MDSRERGERVTDHINAQRAAEDKPRRPRSIRPSDFGGECKRKTYLRFRWADELEPFDGRMLRLFLRGTREEEVFIKELRSIGAHVLATDPDNPGKQIGFSTLHGHVNGFLDAIVCNLMGSREDEVIAEFKTFNDKSFKQLEKLGVEKAKPAHYSQMQLYMHVMGYKEAFYLASNKNDDSLYGEFVTYDQEMCERMMASAEDLIFGALMPPRINENPTFYVCKMCSAHSVCHGDREPDKSCRTCEHSRPATNDDKKLGDMPETMPNIWICEYHGRLLTVSEQAEGCGDFEYNRYLIDALKD